MPILGKNTESLQPELAGTFNISSLTSGGILACQLSVHLEYTRAILMWLQLELAGRMSCATWMFLEHQTCQYAVMES
jgi:hypothetical protein